MHDHGSYGTLRRVGQLLSITLLLLSGASGQKTEAVCSRTTAGWAFNSLGQSPCLTAAFLGQPCLAANVSFDVGALQHNQSYIPHVPSVCECNSVFYSLLSACAFCQDAEISTWSTFSNNCSTISPDGQYTRKVPNGTSIPKWAFQQVRASNKFNITLAQSGITAPPNQTSLPSSSSATPASPTVQQTSPTPPPPPHSKNHAGAIAGGVIGTLCGLAIICGILFFVFRRRRQRDDMARPAQLRPRRGNTNFYLRSSAVREMGSNTSNESHSPVFLPPVKAISPLGIADSVRSEDPSILIIANPNAPRSPTPFDGAIPNHGRIRSFFDADSR